MVFDLYDLNDDASRLRVLTAAAIQTNHTIRQTPLTRPNINPSIRYAFHLIPPDDPFHLQIPIDDDDTPNDPMPPDHDDDSHPTLWTNAPWRPQQMGENRNPNILNE
jgi:hypothetical protein